LIVRYSSSNDNLNLRKASALVNKELNKNRNIYEIMTIMTMYNPVTF
jgi:hypothetical protein